MSLLFAFPLLILSPALFWLYVSFSVAVDFFFSASLWNDSRFLPSRVSSSFSFSILLKKSILSYLETASVLLSPYLPHIGETFLPFADFGLEIDLGYCDSAVIGLVVALPLSFSKYLRACLIRLSAKWSSYSILFRCKLISERTFSW
jgi:hypothetical protein